MREARHIQTSLCHTWLDLDHAKELQVLSHLLDQHPKIAELVWQDLTHTARHSTGARGVPADVVLRALLLKQMHTWSYEELHFHLNDSQTYRTFCRIGIGEKAPARSTLAAAIKQIRPETLEKINALLVLDAERRMIERGDVVRVDCTVVETNVHPPSDSQQIWDCIRVLSHLMKNAREVLPPGSFSFPNRKKRAKRRCREIATTRGRDRRRKSYRDLVKVAEELRVKALEAHRRLRSSTGEPSTRLRLAKQLEHYLGLLERTLDQTRRRVFEGESVPATEKLVSIFEDHTDIIRKDHRDTYYGHKVCLTVGKSSMVLDCQILDGNPADAKLAVGAVERYQVLYGKVPRQIVFDGGFASADNLSSIKKMGSQDVVFTKGRSLKPSAMARSMYIFRKLRNFRAGIEGVISFLKRSFGLHRCTWRSYPSFKSYVWSSIIASNALLMARAMLL